MTPVYNTVTGELVVETKKRQNSSSSSESDSSMASQQTSEDWLSDYW